MPKQKNMKTKKQKNKKTRNKNFCSILILCQIFAMVFLLGTPMVFAEEKAKTAADIPNICWTAAQCCGKVDCTKGIVNGVEREFISDAMISNGKCFSYNKIANSQLGQCYMTPKGSTLKVAIPGMEKVITNKEGTANIAQYVKAIYQFTIVLAALLAVVMIMIAGVRWMTAMGNQGQLDSAKTMMMNSIIGLVLALGSYFILSSINPALVQNKMPQVAMIRTEVLKMQEGDWGDIVFCKDQAKMPYLTPILGGGGYAPCGIPFEKFGCIGIASKSDINNFICMATIDENKKEIIIKAEVSKNFLIKKFTKLLKDKYIYKVSKKYKCGSVYLEKDVEKQVGREELFLGRNCQDENKDCVIFLEEGKLLFKEDETTNPFIIGTYLKKKCY